jgi:hypothetical protein
MSLTTGKWPDDPALQPSYPALPLFGFLLLAIVGQVLIVPSPWTTTRFYRFLCENVSLPNGRRLRFTGGPAEIWYAPIGIGLLGVLPEIMRRAPAGYDPVNLLLLQVAFAFVTWGLLFMLYHWFVANVQSDDRRMSPEFAGSVWAFIGWQLLLVLSFVTVVGWAWVTSGFTRWLCRRIQGNAVFGFTGSGFAILWRTAVFAVACALIVPIPWMLRWYATWYASRITVVPLS